MVRIPNGFNNNIIWNIGHIITVNQKLIYKTSNVPIIIPENFYHQYITGTLPNPDNDFKNIPIIKDLLTQTFEQGIKDYENKKFQGFNSITTGTGFHLTSIEEAFAFNNYHEALHIGLMLNIKKFI